MGNSGFNYNWFSDGESEVIITEKVCLLDKYKHCLVVDSLRRGPYIVLVINLVRMEICFKN